VAEEGQLDPAPLGVALAAARLSALGGTAA
jgi:hypothetical protein